MDMMNLTESILRWLHVIAGVVWIGHLYFFNFVNANFAPTMDAESKKKVVPELMPRALAWFRWGAAFTWGFGLLLLVLVYYHGKQAIEGQGEWSTGALGMLALTFLGVFLYDVLMKTALKTNVAAFWGGFVLVCAALYGYQAAGYSARGVQIHVGALFGTIMAFNVWFRIWPAQKQIITAVKAGTKPEDALVALAGSRSRHNTFMSVPLLFFMVNAHNAWSFTTPGGFPLWPAVITLVGWALVQHLYGASKKVKGF